ncbi:hypothetical protein [Chryseobacterium rhizosphaerae]|uniref:Pectate lyase superfamily protein domain-containing protein n=1 Tax=Chryseobacterium rhizosphaerae TaxID=395937 RepID=A0ABX9IKX9_9FLAO|nr:hypothetical protein [Chryseobacterium rhizosphaerae]REC75694.1 hypothetical protein DRF57_10005 [Chryseobacterium rhizosphaerae]GEN65435.1 hypothetical protein CRH01_00030 [Chryseobacterium rhizosphaerae]
MIFTDVFFSASNSNTDNLVQLVDSQTNEDVNFKRITSWIDGTAMDDTKVDHIIYRKKMVGGNPFYYVRTDVTAGDLDVRIFGVKADDINDDTSALQAAFNAACKLGLNILLPAGIMKTTQGLLLDFSWQGTVKNRIRIIGKGLGNSVIKNYGPTSVPLFIKGPSDPSRPPYFSVSDLTITKPEGETRYGVGLLIQNFIGAEVNNIEISNYDIGFQLVNVCNAQISFLISKYCNYGMYNERTKNPEGFTYPNLLNFQNCTFLGNVKFGAVIISGHAVKFDSCGFEGNVGVGLQFTFAGYNGREALSLINNYFEGNTNHDIYFETSSMTALSLISNTFNKSIIGRVSDVVVNNLSNDQVHMSSLSNSFGHSATYIPSASSKNILYMGDPSKFYLLNNDMHQSSLES